MYKAYTVHVIYQNYLTPKCGHLRTRAECPYYSGRDGVGIMEVSVRRGLTVLWVIDQAWGQHIWVIDQVHGQDGWILASFLFCEFMDRDGVEVHKLTEKKNEVNILPSSPNKLGQ